MAVVSLAAALTAARSPGDPSHPAGQALKDAAMGLAKADQHLFTVARGLWLNNATGETYTANDAAHQRSLRRAERALDQAADGLLREAGRAAAPARSARSGLRAAAARVRSALVRGTAPGTTTEAARASAPKAVHPGRGPR